jgi:hypothetical protein
MAVRLNATAGNYLYRTATLPPVGAGNFYTVCCWVYANTLPANGGSPDTWVVFVALDDGSDDWMTLQVERLLTSPHLRTIWTRGDYSPRPESHAQP